MMENILINPTKFERLGLAFSCDNTSGFESLLQKRLLELFKTDVLPENAYLLIRPTDFQRLQINGLPKIHKPAVPLLPILSMTGSAHTH